MTTRDHIIDELAHGCCVLYVQPTPNNLLCGVCENKHSEGYRVWAENPFTWDTDLYPWGLVCWYCMANTVAAGAETKWYGGT